MPDLVIPTGAAELEEMLGDSARMQNVFGDKAKFGEFIANYARTVNEKDNSIATQVREQTQQVLAQWIRENPDALVRPNMKPSDTHTQDRGERYNRRAPGAKVDELFAQGGDGADLYSVSERFLKAIYHRNESPDARDMRGKLDAIRNDFGSHVPADGGFLIPETLRSEVLRVALETAVVRPRARVVPMETLKIPFPTLDSTSNASSVYGGITGYWTEEGGALTESSAKFGRITLEAKKFTAYTEVPNELFSDSIISLEAFIGQSFPEAVNFFEDVAFMRGDGVGRPLGWLHEGNVAALTVAKETGQAAATIVWENIVKMYARMLPTSHSRAVWIVNQTVFPELATMALSVGTGGSAIWLNNGTEGPPMTILGRPVVVTEKADVLGTAGDISFVDLGYYLIGDRQTIQAETSPHYRFANDQTAIRFIERVDGRPWLKNVVQPHKGDTLSPFVKLATRA